MVDATKHIILDPGGDPLKNMYDALGGQFKEILPKVALNFINQELNNLAKQGRQHEELTPLCKQQTLTLMWPNIASKTNFIYFPPMRA